MKVNICFPFFCYSLRMSSNCSDNKYHNTPPPDNEYEEIPISVDSVQWPPTELESSFGRSIQQRPERSAQLRLEPRINEHNRSRNRITERFSHYYDHLLKLKRRNYDVPEERITRKCTFSCLNMTLIIFLMLISGAGGFGWYLFISENKDILGTCAVCKYICKRIGAW